MHPTYIQGANECGQVFDVLGQRVLAATIIPGIRPVVSAAQRHKVGFRRDHRTYTFPRAKVPARAVNEDDRVPLPVLDERELGPVDGKLFHLKLTGRHALSAATRPQSHRHLAEHDDPAHGSYLLSNTNLFPRSCA